MLFIKKHFATPLFTSPKQQKSRVLRGFSAFSNLIGGGEENRTPVQRHCHKGFSERSLQF